MLLDIAQIYMDAIFAAWEECIGNLPQGTSAMVNEL
jgi:hypothetical protein